MRGRRGGAGHLAFAVVGVAERCGGTEPPAEALAETPQGASAFARYWLALVQDALARGDASALRAVSDAGCGGCTNLISAAESGEPGETVRGAGFTVEFAEAPPLANGETTVVLRYSRAAGELVKADGTSSAIAPEGPIDAEMRIVRAAGGWKVLGFRGTPA